MPTERFVDGNSQHMTIFNELHQTITQLFILFSIYMIVDHNILIFQRKGFFFISIETLFCKVLIACSIFFKVICIKIHYHLYSTFHHISYTSNSYETISNKLRSKSTKKVNAASFNNAFLMPNVNISELDIPRAVKCLWIVISFLGIQCVCIFLCVSFSKEQTVKFQLPNKILFFVA